MLRTIAHLALLHAFVQQPSFGQSTLAFATQQEAGVVVPEKEPSFGEVLLYAVKGEGPGKGRPLLDRVTRFAGRQLRSALN